MITSLKQGILEINEYSVNSDQREEHQELQLLQDLRLQEWYQGDLQGYSEKEGQGSYQEGAHLIEQRRS